MLKRCSYSGVEYQENSFSDIVHQYIEADDRATLDNLKKEIMEHRINELLQWSQGLLSEFKNHFPQRFIKINQNTPQWHIEIDKWNWLGVLLGKLKAYKWAEELFIALYILLCNLQTKDRIAKGTPLHNIGWINLQKGTPESLNKSKYYIKLAMIEDILTDATTYKNLPAYNVLRGEHNISDLRLERMLLSISQIIQDSTNDPFLRPEILYLKFVINPKNQERSLFYDFDLKLATQLFNSTKKAKTATDKGNTLEILMAYLFLTSQNFEVMRNIICYDSQIDLIVRNINIDDPILAEFGKYILVECKNHTKKIDAKIVRDFASKILFSSCNSGVIITKEGITGDQNKEAERDARLTITKFAQRHNLIIVSLSFDELLPIIENKIPLSDILISKYEKIKFDMV